MSQRSSKKRTRGSHKTHLSIRRGRSSSSASIASSAPWSSGSSTPATMDGLGRGPRGEGPSSSQRASPAPSSSSSLPSYSQAMGQTVGVSAQLSSSSGDQDIKHDFAKGMLIQSSSSENGAESMLGVTPRQPPTAPRPPAQQQHAAVQPLCEQPLAKGAAWYVLPLAWWEAWETMCRQEGAGDADDDGAALGPISTEVLVAPDAGAGIPTLRAGIEEGIDFQVVPADAWSLLASWYGLVGPMLERRVIELPSSNTTRIELRPPVLHVYTATAAPAYLVTHTLSTTQTIGNLKSLVSKSLEAALPAEFSSAPSASRLRFWRLPPSSDVPASAPHAQAFKEPSVERVDCESDAVTLAEAQLDQPVERIAVEVKSSGGAWLFDDDGRLALGKQGVRGVFSNDGGDYLTRMHGRDAASATTDNGVQSTGRITRSQTAAERGAEKQRGTTGLYNLGNTCFMNSALQCMANTKELKEYFVSGAWKNEVNASNPLGMGGAIAKVFGELLTKIWVGGGGAVHPREFKMVLSRFSPQFIGYAQQDTQELLAFLLDGLHEDLNRIVKKPYIEAPDWEGGGLREMVTFAHKQWEIYKMRNDSVIVDLFQGQYRSTLVCPDCGKISIKFDPFMYLTLPIPNRQVITRRVTFISFDESKRFESEILIRGEMSIAALKSKVASMAGIDRASPSIAIDYYNKSFYKVFGDFESAAGIAENDVTHIYELPAAVKTIAPLMKMDRFAVSQERLDERESSSTPPAEAFTQPAILPVFSMRGSRNFRSSAFGRPFFIAIPDDKLDDPAYIQAAVFEKYAALATDKAALQRAFASMPSSARRSSEDWNLIQDSEARQPDTVAEIHDEGQSVHIVPDTSMDVDRSGPMAGPSSGMQAPVEIYFHVNRTQDNASVTPKPDNYLNEGEKIWERSARLSAVQMEQGDDAARWPLVYTGGALVCAWTEDLELAVFGTDSEDEDWLRGREEVTDPELESERQPGRKSAKKSLNIEDCMNEFTKEERLGESDPWYCPACKDFKQASKKFDLWKVPDILVVHLKRFSGGRISRDKIDAVIDFPIEGLDLTERVEGTKALRMLEEDEDNDKLMESIGSLDANDDAVEADAPIYDLYAVDNHYGGIGGGHYTAYAKNPEDDKWYYFDDSSVRSADAEHSKTSAAYLLFYRRRTTRPIGGKSRDRVQESMENSRNNSDVEDNGNGESSQSTSDDVLNSSLSQDGGSRPLGGSSGGSSEALGAGRAHLALSDDYSQAFAMPRNPSDIDHADYEPPSWPDDFRRFTLRKRSYSDNSNDSTFALRGDAQDDFGASNVEPFSPGLGSQRSSPETDDDELDGIRTPSPTRSLPVTSVPARLWSGAGAGGSSRDSLTKSPLPSDAQDMRPYMHF